MKLIKLINEEIIKLNEVDLVTGKSILNVDIQPEYESGFSFDKYKWAKFLNKNNNNNNIVFLYNGEDTMGMISHSDYIMWLMELGVKESVIDHAIFYDKGYNYFRSCMDEYIDDDEIVNFVKYMNNHNIYDSRDLNNETWDDFVEAYGYEKDTSIRALLENSNDLLSIPELMDFLKRYNNILLTGGGINECLKEVEIALKALNKPYTTFHKFTY